MIRLPLVADNMIGDRGDHRDTLARGIDYTRDHAAGRVHLPRRTTKALFIFRGTAGHPACPGSSDLVEACN
jgi:hypothetical protein